MKFKFNPNRDIKIDIKIKEKLDYLSKILVGQKE